MALKAEWHDLGREPKCTPDPNYPDGKDVDVSFGAPATCETTLEHPTPRCGLYIVRCDVCGYSIALTTAGRPDDPRFLKVACKVVPETKQ